jgi:GntR family transcriptional regulator
MAEPMYRQIAEDLRRQIEAGEAVPGGQLPTELELREQYNASRNTVRDAIKWLTTRGLVETRPGQGTFVVEKINPYVTTLTGDPQAGFGGEDNVYLAEAVAAGRIPEYSAPHVEIHRATSEIASSLRIEEGATVIARHQQRFLDGIPWSLQTSFYPMSLVEHGATRLLQATNIDEGTVAYLANHLGIKQVGYRDTLAVRPPDENEARFFNLPADGRIPVFEIFRVGFDSGGERFRLTVTVYPSDRNRLRVEVGEVPQRELPRTADRPHSSNP